MRYIAAFVALVSFGFLYRIQQTDIAEHTTLTPTTLTPKQDESLLAANSDLVHADATEDSQPESSGPVVSRDSMVLNESPPPPFVEGFGMSIAEGLFAAEPIDAEWSARMSKAILDSLNGSERGYANIHVNCRSTTCRVELESAYPIPDEMRDQYQSQVQDWIGRVMLTTGFVEAKSQYIVDRSTTVHYFKVIETGFDGIPPVIADALRQHIRDRSEEIRRQSARP